ncbi:hypothetical protein KAU11_08730 [Candidatus Babeliales bacterium]|nr:hypothetical protein [Candidatus Babeliales bacterium]
MGGSTDVCAEESAFIVAPTFGYGSLVEVDGESNSGFVFGVNSTYIVDRWLLDVAYATVPGAEENRQAIMAGFGTVFGLKANKAAFNILTKPQALSALADEERASIYPYLMGGAEVDITGNSVYGFYAEGGALIPIALVNQWTRLGIRGTWLSDEVDNYAVAVIVSPVIPW